MLSWREDADERDGQTVLTSDALHYPWTAGYWEQVGVTAEDLERVYREARWDVYRHVALLGVPPAEAQEITQEAFLRLHLAIRDGQRIETPRAWVFTVAHRLGLNHRKANHERRLPLPLQQEAVAARGMNPEQQALDTERQRRVRAALDALPPQQRQCLLLRADGLRYREIAAVVGVKTSTVGEFLQRAMRRMREVIHG